MIGIGDSSVWSSKSNRAKNKFSEREVSFVESRLSKGEGEERRGSISITLELYLMDDCSMTHYRRVRLPSMKGR